MYLDAAAWHALLAPPAHVVAVEDVALSLNLDDGRPSGLHMALQLRHPELPEPFRVAYEVPLGMASQLHTLFAAVMADIDDDHPPWKEPPP